MRARHQATEQLDDPPVTLRGGPLRKALRDARDKERESGPQLKAARAAQERDSPPQPIRSNTPAWASHVDERCTDLRHGST